MRVDTAPALKDALQQGGFDLVLSDFVLADARWASGADFSSALMPRRTLHCPVGNDQRQSSKPDFDLRSHGVCAEAPSLDLPHSIRRVLSDGHLPAHQLA